jgi:hypothetical protein
MKVSKLTLVSSVPSHNDTSLVSQVLPAAYGKNLGIAVVAVLSFFILTFPRPSF